MLLKGGDVGVLRVGSSNSPNPTKERPNKYILCSTLKLRLLGLCREVLLKGGGVRVFALQVA